MKDVIDLAKKCGANVEKHVCTMFYEFTKNELKVFYEAAIEIGKAQSAAELEEEEEKSSDNYCICKGNWRLIVKEYQSLLGSMYVDKDGQSWTFFGLVNAEDDYYYGLSNTKGKTILLSCVGSIDGFGYTLQKPSDKG